MWTTILGILVISFIVILGMVIAKMIKGRKQKEDRAGAGNEMVRGGNGEKRGYLSRQASRALDEKMDAEDPRFYGTKYW